MVFEDWIVKSKFFSIKAGAGFPVPAFHLPFHIGDGILSKSILFTKIPV